MTAAILRALRRMSILVLGAAAILSLVAAVDVLVRFGPSQWLIASLLCLIGVGAARLMLRPLRRGRTGGEAAPPAEKRPAGDQ